MQNFSLLVGRLGLSLIFISHNLSVVRHLCDRVMVLYLGKVMESGSTGSIFAAPRHPYTRSLLAAAPRISGDGLAQLAPLTLRGEPPSPIDPPQGCRFRTRCAVAAAQCVHEAPLAAAQDEAHLAACHFPLGRME